MDRPDNQPRHVFSTDELSIRIVGKYPKGGNVEFTFAHSEFAQVTLPSSPWTILALLAMATGRYKEFGFAGTCVSAAVLAKKSESLGVLCDANAQYASSAVLRLRRKLNQIELPASLAEKLALSNGSGLGGCLIQRDSSLGYYLSSTFALFRAT